MGAVTGGSGGCWRQGHMSGRMMGPELEGNGVGGGRYILGWWVSLTTGRFLILVSHVVNGFIGPGRKILIQILDKKV